MNIDIDVILLIIRLVKKFGARRISQEIDKAFRELTNKTSKDYSFEKQEIARLVWEV